MQELRTQTWAWLQGVRRFMEDRKRLLGTFAEAMDTALGDLNARREELMEVLRKRLMREHKDYIRRNPALGQRFLQEQVDADEAIAAIDRQYGSMKSNLDWVVHARHRLTGESSAVLSRQAEIFRELAS